MPGIDLLNGLKLAVESGMVTARRHPALPLTVYNYTNACQYARAWTPVTAAARGLVIDDAGQVVAQPWGKFFNAHEHGGGQDFAPPLPDEPFQVYEKVDGSLAVIFWYGGAWQVATRGSFDSAQAAWAQARLDKCDTANLVPGLTYCAEIVFPRNRIVVDYGDREDLVLLGATRTGGADVPLTEVAPHWDGIGSVVRTYPMVPLTELAQRAADGRDLTGRAVAGIESEGWVIRYASGLRVKVKMADYVRLAAVVGEVGMVDLWRWLAIERFGPSFTPKYLGRALGCPAEDIAGLGGDYGAPLRGVAEQIPDEYHEQLRSAADQITWCARNLFTEMKHAFKQVRTIHDRGDFARAVQQRYQDPGMRAALFHLFDGKTEEAKLRAWVGVRPQAERLFRTLGG